MSRVRDGIYGLCIGDALGVPAEFRDRASLRKSPITDMVGGGVHNQPAGTWSDDSSMALCLAASIAETGGIHTNDIMNRFMEWYGKGEYSPWGECFDCGHTVAQALSRYRAGTTAALCGGNKISDNGNGSLMRIFPMVYYVHLLDSVPGADLTVSSRAMELIHKVSGLTHRHPIAQSACGIYINIAARLLYGIGLEEAVGGGIRTSLAWYKRHDRFHCVESVWKKIEDIDAFRTIGEDEIKSGGYVVDTLQAALWCLLNTTNYRDCVLKAVNMGDDPDTTAAVAGGLAGLVYGYEYMPDEWNDALKGKDVIEKSCVKLVEYWDSECEKSRARSMSPFNVKTRQAVKLEKNIKNDFGAGIRFGDYIPFGGFSYDIKSFEHTKIKDYPGRDGYEVTQFSDGKGRFLVRLYKRISSIGYGDGKTEEWHALYLMFEADIVNFNGIYCKGKDELISADLCEGLVELPRELADVLLDMDTW